MIRLHSLLLPLALAAALAALLGPGPAQTGVADADSDGIPDSFDNCIFAPNGPLSGGASQCFTNEDGDDDGYGNRCDGDFNNDGATGLRDLDQVVEAFDTVDAELDVGCDGFVGFDDLNAVLFWQLQPPGPSGLPCAEANEKGTCPPI